MRLWDARTRQAERVLLGHEGEVTALAFTPDGRFLLSASRDRVGAGLGPAAGRGRADAAPPRPRSRPRPHCRSRAFSSPLAPTAARACGTSTGSRTRPPDRTAAPPTARMAGETVRARATAIPAVTRSTTLREDLRRAAPVAVPALPRLARRRAVGPCRRRDGPPARRRDRLDRRPPAAPPTSACLLTMAEGVPKRARPHRPRALRRIAAPLETTSSTWSGCAAGTPMPVTSLAVASGGAPGVVADVLDGAPLDSPEPMTARRLRRNAASALAGLRGEAVAAVCAGLGDAREGARAVAAMALGVLDDPAASSCVRDAAGGRRPVRPTGRGRPPPAGRPRPRPRGRGLGAHGLAPRIPRPRVPPGRPPPRPPLLRASRRAGRATAPGRHGPRGGRGGARGPRRDRAGSPGRPAEGRRRLVAGSGDS